jgi:hypothetical protein
MVKERKPEKSATTDKSCKNAINFAKLEYASPLQRNARSML